MPQISSLSIVILRHSGQRCWCFFNGEFDVLIFASPRRGIILPFISTMSQYSADLSGHGANAITPRSNLKAKLGEDFHRHKCLHWARFMENCVIFMSEAGWTAQLWIHCVSKVVMARQQRNSSKNSFELYPDLRHRLTDVSAKRRDLPVVACPIVM